MEHGPFIDGLAFFKMGIFHGELLYRFNNQMVYPYRLIDLKDPQSHCGGAGPMFSLTTHMWTIGY